ncbi:hypothetical protein HYV30_00990 [Candidatus Kaiserbacteria bacterium]|nr:hypothetical protein [Candidatus Kaiserbacteria bacterium]
MEGPEGNREWQSIEKKEKPPVLYIAAQTPNLQELTPREGRNRGENEGAVIFATPNKELASIFLVEGHDDSWMQIGYFSDVPYVTICMNRDDFLKRDHGGTMYEVSSNAFNFDPNLGMGEKEWTSRDPVTPISETHYASALDAMIENGVNVYFADQATFDAVNNADDHGLSILLSLTSENKLRNKVTKPLEDLSE